MRSRTNAEQRLMSARIQAIPKPKSHNAGRGAYRRLDEAAKAAGRARVLVPHPGFMVENLKREAHQRKVGRRAMSQGRYDSNYLSEKAMRIAASLQRKRIRKRRRGK